MWRRVGTGSAPRVCAGPRLPACRQLLHPAIQHACLGTPALMRTSCVPTSPSASVCHRRLDVRVSAPMPKRVERCGRTNVPADAPGTRHRRVCRPPRLDLHPSDPASGGFGESPSQIAEARAPMKVGKICTPWDAPRTMELPHESLVAGRQPIYSNYLVF